MENGNRPNQPTNFTREAWARIVDEIDALTRNPHQRAEYVWEILQDEGYFERGEITNYDMTCFCIWYLSFMTDALPYIKPLAKHLNIVFHRFHYQAAEELGLIEPKEKNEPIRKISEISPESLGLPRNYTQE